MATEPTVSSGVAVYLDSTGKLGTVTSSRRFREEVEDIGEASDALLRLRPVTSTRFSLSFR